MENHPVVETAATARGVIKTYKREPYADMTTRGHFCLRVVIFFDFPKYEKIRIDILAKRGYNVPMKGRILVYEDRQNRSGRPYH